MCRTRVCSWRTALVSGPRPAGRGAVDARDHVLGLTRVAPRDAAGADVRPADVFRPLLVTGAVRFYLGRCDASGAQEPSEHDFALARRLADLGAALGVELSDLLILGAAGAYHSLREHGQAVMAWRDEARERAIRADPKLARHVARTGRQEPPSPRPVAHPRRLSARGPVGVPRVSPAPDAAHTRVPPLRRRTDGALSGRPGACRAARGRARRARPRCAGRVGTAPVARGLRRARRARAARDLRPLPATRARRVAAGQHVEDVCIGTCS
jgi:hypothetical protein